MSTESDLVAALARARGVSEAVIRVEFPATAGRYVCEGCGHVWDSREAADACATYDDTTD